MKWLSQVQKKAPLRHGKQSQKYIVIVFYFIWWPSCQKEENVSVGPAVGKDFEVRMAATSVRDKASEEVKRYRERDPLPLQKKPLQWWKEQQNLPLLSSLAKRYLCIPATSVASERVFSTVGDIVSTKHSLLKHENVDQLIFLKKNLPSKKTEDSDDE